MDFVPIVTVIEQTLQQIRERFPENKEHFKKCMEEFTEMVRRKTIDHPVFSNDLIEKIKVKREKEKRLREKLENLHSQNRKETAFNEEIIFCNCELIKQQEQQHNELMTRERELFQSQIALQQNVFNTREAQEYKPVIDKLLQQLEESQIQNAATERTKRHEWIKLNEKFNEIKLNYDTQMSKLRTQIEYTNELHDNEEKELQYYKHLYESEDDLYHELMKEKEEYLEGVRQQKLYEIRVRLAKRTIVRFIEQYYPIWKKKKIKASKKKSKYRFLR